MRITYRSKHNTKYWENRWSKIRADNPIQNEKIYPIKFANMIVKDKNQKILEAGCGAGRVLRYYHEKNFQIVGIEFIKSIIKTLKEVDNSLDVRYGNILNLDFSDKYCDQLPGAEPKSTILIPFLIILNLLSISLSL